MRIAARNGRPPGDEEVTMDVQTIMTPNPFVATRHSTLADVAKIMADHEIGVVPIVDAGERVVGILTDRDLCKAIASMNRPPAEIAAIELASKPVVCCDAHDDLASALKIMRQRHIRRLPVVDERGQLRGILSIDDVVLRSEDERESGGSPVSFGDAVMTLKAIYGNRGSRRPGTLPV